MALAGGQSYQESSFESEMFEVCVFHRLEGCFCELIENNRKVSLGEISGTFGAIPVEIGEQPMKVLIMSNMLTRWAQGVNNGRTVTINGGGALVKVLVQIHEKI